MAKALPCSRRASVWSRELALREELWTRPHPRRGQIWSAYIPGQTTDPHQPRYVLIISEDRRNEARDHFLVVPIYSRGRGPTRIPLPAGEGGIERDSVLFCEEINCINEEFLEAGPMGDLISESALQRVVVAVTLAITPSVENAGE
jgi:mRNA-degrading endonuclease toxin of MazEF toxin-antitoxin module